ncbi:MAG: serine hydrolase domain-containing protein [Polaribacter sp.]
MKRFIIIFIIGFTLIVGCKKSSKELLAKRTPAQTLVDSFSKNNHDAGVLLLTQINNKSSIYSAGYASVDTKEKVTKNSLFEIGSASKMFTAIAIMQLIEDGKLSLKTTLNTLYPSGDIQKLAKYNGKNYWDKVTVEMLLNHTSGFIDYLNVYDSDEEALKIFNNSKKQYTFNDIVNLAINYGDANFIPDSKFSYSNTNYIILGNIISKISKTPWRTYIENHIFKKTGLKNTVFGSKMSPKQKERLVTGYYKKQITNMPFTLAGSAGAIVSNAYDLQKFLTYWVEGKFYKNPEMLKDQISTGVHNMYPDTDLLKYALGVMELDGTLGHAGQTFGFQSYLAINLTTKNTHIILINNADASSFDLLRSILEIDEKKSE